MKRDETQWVVCNLGWASWGIIGIGMISTGEEMEMMGGTKGEKRGQKGFLPFFFLLLLPQQPHLGSSSTRQTLLY